MIYIGIDPDTDKSGLAIWNTERQAFIEVGSYPFEICMNKINQHPTAIIVLEDSNLDSHIWNAKGLKRAIALTVARKVGRVDMVARAFLEALKPKFKVSCIAPSRRKKGINTKLSAPKFKAITGWTGRTNSEGRDAGMLVYGRT